MPIVIFSRHEPPRFHQLKATHTLPSIHTVSHPGPDFYSQNEFRKSGVAAAPRRPALYGMQSKLELNASNIVKYYRPAAYGRRQRGPSAHFFTGAAGSHLEK
jgi:hypothetical protein